MPTVDHEKSFSAKLMRISAAPARTNRSVRLTTLLPLLGDRRHPLLDPGVAVEEAGPKRSTRSARA